MRQLGGLGRVAREVVQEGFPEEVTFSRALSCERVYARQGWEVEVFPGRGEHAGLVE